MKSVANSLLNQDTQHEAAALRHLLRACYRGR